MKSCRGTVSHWTLFLVMCISPQCEAYQGPDELVEYIQHLQQLLSNTSVNTIKSKIQQNSPRVNLTLKIEMAALFETQSGIHRETTKIAINGSQTEPNGTLDNISYELHESCDTEQSIQISRKNQTFLPGEGNLKNGTIFLRPKHCEDIQNYLDENGILRRNGVYHIYVDNNRILRQMLEVEVSPNNNEIASEFNNGVDVFCDLETDGGGWTVIQRRMDATPFNRTWSEYTSGFGNASESYWLGLTTIHELTKTRNVSLRVDLEDFEGKTRSVKYDVFRVDGPENKYRLHIRNHSGNLEDKMAYHNGQMFSTFDQDNDAHATSHCAQDFGAGWWFKYCRYVNLNGLYRGAKTDPGVAYGIYWSPSYFKRAEMKIRNATFINK